MSVCGMTERQSAFNCSFPFLLCRSLLEKSECRCSCATKKRRSHTSGVDPHKSRAFVHESCRSTCCSVFGLRIRSHSRHHFPAARNCRSSDSLYPRHPVHLRLSVSHSAVALVSLAFHVLLVHK